MPRRVMLEQRLAVGGLDQRQEFAGDLELGAGAGHEALGHDLLDLRHGRLALVAGVMKRRSTSPLAQGATVLTVCPPDTTPTLSVMPLPGSLSACSASVLCASSLIALMPASKLAPECAALPVISKRMNTPPLRPVTATPAPRPGSELNTARARPRESLDHLARERRADLLVAGEQRRDRRGCAAELLQRRQHEAIHHQAGLHVGDAGTVGAAARRS